jgi:uncharacterized protein GlcG (DUF336 family)
MKRLALLFALSFSIALPAAEPVAATRILVPLMMQGAIAELEPTLRSRVGAPLQIDYELMPKLVQRLHNGETPDVTMISRAAAQQLAAKGLVKSQQDLVQSQVGIAVAEGAPTPVLRTPEDVVAFLKATPSIALFGIGASGPMMIQLAEQNGFAAALRRKATIINEGYTSALLRDGKVAAAVQQVSELKAGGARNIVPLPESMQSRSGTVAVIFSTSRHAETAAQVVQVLTSSDAASAYQRAGLQPLFVAPTSAPARLSESTDPGALPGDFVDLPQSAQLRVNLGPPAGTRASQPPAMDPAASPGVALALEAAQAAMASCEADGYHVAVAVTDSAGKLKAALAGDGVASNRVYMALRKDVTVVGFRLPTLALRTKIEADPSLLAQVKPNMALLPGGIPIMRGDLLIGAIAVSGATAHEEEKCARAGVQRIQARLPAAGLQ